MPQLVGIEQDTAVKDERWFLHVVVYLCPVNVAELSPLGRDNNSFSVLAGLKRGGEYFHTLLHCKSEVS